MVYTEFQQSLYAPHQQILHFEVFFHAMMRTLAPQAAFFDAAERRLRRRDDAFVDADHPVFEPFGHSPDASDVAGIEVASEAEFRGVRHVDRLLFGLEPKERRDRSEGFLTRYGHARGDVA